MSHYEKFSNDVKSAENRAAFRKLSRGEDPGVSTFALAYVLLGGEFPVADPEDEEPSDDSLAFLERLFRLRDTRSA